MATADPPTRTYLPAAPFVVPTCPRFDVLVTPLINNEYAITFSNGAMIITGRYVTQLSAESRYFSILPTPSTQENRRRRCWQGRA